MTQLTFTLPTVGQNNASEDPLTRTALSDIKTAHNADHATGGHTLGWLAGGSSAQVIVCDGSGVPTYRTLSGATLSNTGVLSAIPDATLSSPNNSVYRNLLVAGTGLGNDSVAGTYIITADPASAPPVSGGVITSAGNVTTVPPVLHFVAADYAVAGLTQKLRLRAQVMANATAPGINFTFGLYPFTVAGAADTLAYTLGTVVTGSTLAVNTPSASTPTLAVNSDFTVPADGIYVLGVVTSGTLANNSAVLLNAQLQTRHV